MLDLGAASEGSKQADSISWQRAKMFEKNAILLLCKNDLVELYRKFGFIDLGESSSTHGGFSWHAMRRALT